MFKSPFYLLLILPAILLWLLPLFLKQKGLNFTSLEVGQIFKGLRSRFHYIPRVLILISIILLIIVLAQPIKPPIDKNYKREGIAIELVMDISGSMDEHIRHGLKIVRKIDLVKAVVQAFVLGDESENELYGRADDLIGLVTFAKFSNTIYPLTFNRRPFLEALSSVEIAGKKVDGTHFGAGLEMGIARLDTINEKEDDNIKSRVIIFLTDGLNRIDDIDPLEMAKRAKEKDIRIYTIAFHTSSQQLLKYIASISGGKSYQASDASTLLAIYNEINKLEKEKLGDIKPSEGEPDFIKFLFSAFVLLLISYILELTLFRRFP